MKHLAFRLLPVALLAGVAALWAGGFVRPNDLPLGVGDGENVFAVRRAHKHEALGLGGEHGK